MSILGRFRKGHAEREISQEDLWPVYVCTRCGRTIQVSEQVPSGMTRELGIYNKVPEHCWCRGRFVRRVPWEVLSNDQLKRFAADNSHCPVCGSGELGYHLIQGCAVIYCFSCNKLWGGEPR